MQIVEGNDEYHSQRWWNSKYHSNGLLLVHGKSMALPMGIADGIAKGKAKWLNNGISNGIANSLANGIAD